MFADLRIPSGECGGRSVCRFKDSGTGRWGDQCRECGGRSVCRFKDSGTGGTRFADLRIPGRGYWGGAFADLRILGRDDGWTSVCRFKDSQRGMWGEERLQI